MHKDHLDPDELEENNVLHDLLLEFFIDHGISAVFDHNNGPGVMLNIGHCLHQHFGPLRVGKCLHLFFLPAFDVSGPVVAVDLHVVIGQITAPGHGGCVPIPERDQNVDFLCRQDFCGLLLGKIHAAAHLAHHDFAFL